MVKPFQLSQVTCSWVAVSMVPGWGRFGHQWQKDWSGWRWYHWYSTAICIFFEGGPPIHLLILFLLLVRNLNKGLPILQLLVHLHLQLWPTHAWRHPAQEARYLLYYQWWVPWYSEIYNLCLPGMQPPLETPPNNSSLYRLAVLQSPTFPASKSGLPGRSSIWTACCLAGDGAASEILGNTEASWTGIETVDVDATPGETSSMSPAYAWAMFLGL